MEPDWSSSIASGTPKPAWDSMPEAVRRRLDAELGSVRSVADRPGGFTPSVAAVVRAADGRQAFVKAVDADAYPIAAAMHRDEAAILRGLGEIAEVPRILASFDESGWVVLVLEAVAGRHPHLPWQRDDLGRVLTSLSSLSRQLTPSPIAAPPVAQRLDRQLRGWRTLRDDPGRARRLELGRLTGAVPLLAEIEAEWGIAAAGGTLLHGDLRADQILLSDTAVHIVDWPHVSVGAPWLDPLFLFPSVRLQGGPGIDELVRMCELTADAPGDELTTVAVALAGYFLHHSTLPPPPGLPTVRAFQRAQGGAMVDWLADRLDV